MNKIKVKLGTIQETLLIPLHARYLETQKVNGLINDKASVELVEKIDYDFSKFGSDKKTALFCILRGLILDNLAKKYIEKYPQGIIIDIGVGLDTRYDRLANNEIKYFELDLPDTMDLRKKLILENQNRQFINDSILNDKWIEVVLASNQKKQPCLFIVEGVFQYMSELEIKKIFATIKKYFPGSFIAFDIMSPSIIKRSNKALTSSFKKLSAKFTWGLLNPQDIHSWDKNYKVIEVKTYFDFPSHFLKEAFTPIQKLIFKFVPYPIKMVLVKIEYI